METTKERVRIEIQIGQKYVKQGTPLKCTVKGFR